jgi:hypothetical protein
LVVAEQQPVVVEDRGIGEIVRLASVGLAARQKPPSREVIAGSLEYAARRLDHKPTEIAAMQPQLVNAASILHDEWWRGQLTFIRDATSTWFYEIVAWWLTWEWFVVAAFVVAFLGLLWGGGWLRSAFDLLGAIARIGQPQDVSAAVGGKFKAIGVLHMVYVAPIYEELLKHVLMRLGLASAPFLFGCLEAYLRPIEALDHPILHWWFSSHGLIAGVLWHSAWNGLVVCMARDLLRPSDEARYALTLFGLVRIVYWVYCVYVSLRWWLWFCRSGAHELASAVLGSLRRATRRHTLMRSCVCTACSVVVEHDVCFIVRSQETCCFCFGSPPITQYGVVCFSAKPVVYTACCHNILQAMNLRMLRPVHAPEEQAFLLYAGAILWWAKFWPDLSMISYADFYSSKCAHVRLRLDKDMRLVDHRGLTPENIPIVDLSGTFITKRETRFLEDGKDPLEGKPRNVCNMRPYGTIATGPAIEAIEEASRSVPYIAKFWRWPEVGQRLLSFRGRHIASGDFKSFEASLRGLHFRVLECFLRRLGVDEVAAAIVFHYERSWRCRTKDMIVWFKTKEAGRASGMYETSCFNNALAVLTHIAKAIHDHQDLTSWDLCNNGDNYILGCEVIPSDYSVLGFECAPESPPGEIVYCRCVLTRDGRLWRKPEEFLARFGWSAVLDHSCSDVQKQSYSLMVARSYYLMYPSEPIVTSWCVMQIRCALAALGGRFDSRVFDKRPEAWILTLHKAETNTAPAYYTSSGSDIAEFARIFGPELDVELCEAWCNRNSDWAAVYQGGVDQWLRGAQHKGE